jgi:hypothetical protein
MRARLSLWVVILAILVTVVSCVASPGQDAPSLAFRAPLNVDSGQRFHVSLGVENVGDTRFRDYGAFNGLMTLRDDAGMELGRIQVTTLWELTPDSAGWPAAYASKLPAGAYRLTWGAPDYGSVTVDFTIVELEGWLYLGQESIQSTDSTVLDDSRKYGALQSLVDLARVNLSHRLGVELEAVAVQSIEEAEFSDTSLGVPEPDTLYAQVLTPGYAIKLAVAGQTYEYRASDQRLVFVPQQGPAPEGSITIEGVEVAAGEQIVVSGQSTLPDGTCLGSELWADGDLQAWWPGDACVPVEAGRWQMVVRLGRGEVPSQLNPLAQYMLRAYEQNGPDLVAVFAFDLGGPPTPEPEP